MQSFTAGQSNRIRYDLLNRSTGEPITSGTVTVYLQAMSGDNEGLYWRGLDNSWQSSVSVAAAASHDDDGHWHAVIAAGAWGTGVRYSTWARESGGLHVSVSEEIVEISPPLSLTVESEVSS